MQRVFLRDEGRYKAGEIKDFPPPTWKNFFPGYEDYTRAPAEIMTEMVVERLGLEGSDPEPKPRIKSGSKAKAKKEAAHA